MSLWYKVRRCVPPFHMQFLGHWLEIREWYVLKPCYPLSMVCRQKDDVAFFVEAFSFSVQYKAILLNNVKFIVYIFNDSIFHVGIEPTTLVLTIRLCTVAKRRNLFLYFFNRKILRSFPVSSLSHLLRKTFIQLYCL